MERMLDTSAAGHYQRQVIAGHPLAEHLDPADPFVRAAERLAIEARVAITYHGEALKSLADAMRNYETVAHPAPPPDRPTDCETVYARTIRAGDFIRYKSYWVRVTEVKHISDVGPTFFLVYPNSAAALVPQEYAENAYINRRTAPELPEF